MRAQRTALQVVNGKPRPEQLFGLSRKAIERWSITNDIPADSEIVSLLTMISDRLQFMANRSQMQVSDEYAHAARDVGELTARLRNAIRRTV